LRQAWTFRHGNFKPRPALTDCAADYAVSKGTFNPVDFADTNPHEFKLEYSHSGDQSGGGLTLKWERPHKFLLDEAVAQPSKPTWLWLL